jgi:pimeloyl-ACP methyl ester carboxylesterase
LRWKVDSIRRLSLLSVLVFALLAGCGSPAELEPRGVAAVLQASALPTTLELPGSRAPILAYNVQVPPGAIPGRPLTVLLALHGMGGNGPDFARPVAAEAATQGWLLVAPTIDYRDWRDPEVVRRDGLDLLPALKGLLDDLPAQTGLTIRRRVLVYGFSRGGQTAHRFALFYPRLARAVAAMATGTYTLPATEALAGPAGTPLNFPFGLADLSHFGCPTFDPDAVRQVDFWLGVGERDQLAQGASRQWDPYIGATRIERAESFAEAVAELGGRSELAVFANAAHEVTDEMRGQALAFLERHED